MVKPLEAVGNILGYIPGVSTITGIIKYFVYINKAETANKETADARTRALDIATKTAQLGLSYTAKENLNSRLGINDPTPEDKVTKALETKERTYRDLAELSLFEMIPFYNIVMAVEETFSLKHLDDTRKTIRESEKQIPKLEEEYSGESNYEFYSEVRKVLRKLDLPQELKDTTLDDTTIRLKIKPTNNLHKDALIAVRSQLMVYTLSDMDYDDRSILRGAIKNLEDRIELQKE